jgi:hypothetical protein
MEGGADMYGGMPGGASNTAIGPSGEAIHRSAGDPAFLQQAERMGFKPHNDQGGDADGNLREDMADLMNMGYNAKDAATMVTSNENQLGANGRSLEDWTNHTDLNQLQQIQNQGGTIQANGGRGFQGAAHDGNFLDDVGNFFSGAANTVEGALGLGGGGLLGDITGGAGPLSLLAL